MSSGRRLRPVRRWRQHCELHILQLRGRLLLLRRGTHGRVDDVERDNTTSAYRHRVHRGGGVHDRGVAAE